MSRGKYSLTIDRIFLVVDVIMVMLVIINLTLLGIQMNFESAGVRNLLNEYAHPFYILYLPVYENFVFVDGVFVTIFITEILIRWSVSIYNQTYHRWFFYPFARWYEVLGCIPIGSFRALRILRVVAIIVRLNRMKIIDVRQWYFYKVFLKYINVIAEEVSDRVVVNVIEGVQKEIKGGIPVTEKIIQQAILPRKDVLVNYFSGKIQQITKEQYDAHKDELRESIRTAVSSAVRKNQNIKILEQTPLIGKAASAALQQSVYDITFQTINTIFERMAANENRPVVEKIVDGVIDSIMQKQDDRELQDAINDVVVHSLELVKHEVLVQQWKVDEKIQQQLLNTADRED